VTKKEKNQDIDTGSRCYKNVLRAVINSLVYKANVFVTLSVTNTWLEFIVGPKAWSQILVKDESDWQFQTL